MKKTCKHCGKRMTRTVYSSGKVETKGCFSIRKFCSRSCSSAAQRGVSKNVLRGPLKKGEVEFLRLHYRKKGRSYCAAALKVTPGYLTKLMSIYKRKCGPINFLIPAPPPPKPVATRQEMLEDIEMAWWEVRRQIENLRWVTRTGGVKR